MKLPPVDYEVIELKGGYDVLTPTLKLPPGYVRDAQNFEVSVNGGYTRIAGYERFDGRAAPSSAVYGTIGLNAVANVSLGDTITGPSGTGVVIAIAGTTIVFTRATGSVAVGHAILRGGLPVGTVTTLSPPITARNRAVYQALAADNYRASIGVVPGSGPVRGVLNFEGQIYAWRNNAGGTALVIHRATPAGWVVVPLGWELEYDQGSLLIEDGEVVVGATSGATGTVGRQTVTGGTYAGLDASGRLILTARTGTFVLNENLTVSGVTRARAKGAAVAITLTPGGRVQTVLGNFGGLATTRVYGCDGINRGFEFDGTVYVPIRTGMVLDSPSNVAVHSNHLFFSFDASLQNSSIGEPYRWSIIFGAGEIVMRDAITAMQPVQGTTEFAAMAVYTVGLTSILYGTSTADFTLVPFSDNTGGLRYTVQRMDTSYALDTRGVVSLTASQNFGNFDTTTLTFNIRPFIQSRRSSAVASGLNREKSQYRVFYADGSALYMTIVNGEYLGAMPIKFPVGMFCWTEGESADGTEQSFMGGSNGYVYQIDSGTSFDGADIEATLLLNYNPVRSPRVRKRFRKASVEVTGSSYAEFRFGYELGYGLPDNEQPYELVYETRFSSSFWDSLVWDQFTWDGKTLAPSETEMTGTAENVALRLRVGSNFIREFTINSVILHYTMRRGLR